MNMLVMAFRVVDVVGRLYKMEISFNYITNLFIIELNPLQFYYSIICFPINSKWNVNVRNMEDSSY